MVDPGGAASDGAYANRIVANDALNPRVDHPRTGGPRSVEQDSIECGTWHMETRVG